MMPGAQSAPFPPTCEQEWCTAATVTCVKGRGCSCCFCDVGGQGRPGFLSPCQSPCVLSSYSLPRAWQVTCQLLPFPLAPCPKSPSCPFPGTWNLQLLPWLPWELEGAQPVFPVQHSYQHGFASSRGRTCSYALSGTNSSQPGVVCH